MIKYILMDIEGTTTSIDFVHQTLFPYSSQHLREFIQRHSQESHISAYMKEASKDMKLNSEDLESIIRGLLRWIEEDKKHYALKKLQGLVWKEGYQKNLIKAHIYEDVPPAWESWRTHNLKLAIYSSGSIEAQKLLFGHTIYGDLNRFLSAYFDTSIGHKKEKSSYENISMELKVKPQKILFLSDRAEELDAAKETGMKTCQIVREGTLPSSNHLRSSNFYDISNMWGG